jgi:signal transduction histidine kinase
VVLLIGTIISVVASAWLWNGEQQRVALLLDGSGQVVVDSAAESISDAVGRLNAVAGLFKHTEEVTRDEFRRFVEHLGLLPGLGAIGYMPLVPAADLDGFVAEMRETIPDYTVFELDETGERIPVGERSEYVPAQWSEPSDAFARIQGFDSFSEPNRAAVLERARDTGELAATPFLQLVAEDESDGFLLYWPMTDPETEEVVGFAVGPMDLSELLDSGFLTILKGQVGWNVTDVTDVTTDAQPGLQTDGSWVGSLEVGGRLWRITVIPRSPSEMVANPAVPLAALAVGVLISVLIAVGLHLYRQRLQADRELEKLRDLARAKDQFLASVSHELRTPLTGVLGYAELLKDNHSELSDDERLSMISSVTDNASDLAYIIDDLLVAARSEPDMLAVTRVPVDLRAQVAQVLETAGGDMVAGVEVIGDPKGSYQADADPARVRQILRNLINNASRYGGDQVQVRLANTNDTVQVQVADNGPGLPHKEWERIFEPYYRAHHNHTQPAAVGIGLSVARQLARLMHGELTYRREDIWSVLELELPITATSEDER